MTMPRLMVLPDGEEHRVCFLNEPFHSRLIHWERTGTRWVQDPCQTIDCSKCLLGQRPLQRFSALVTTGEGPAQLLELPIGGWQQVARHLNKMGPKKFFETTFRIVRKRRYSGAFQIEYWIEPR